MPYTRFDNNSLVIGTGQVAPMLIEAHAAVRPINRLLVWGRSREKAETMAEQYAGYQGHFGAIERVEVVEDLAQSCAEADIISCATLSTSPIVQGDWLTPGTHLDLVGAFRRDMRECDAKAVARSDVYVDTWPGARGEAGDLHQAAAEGMFSFDDIKADLEQLTQGRASGRTDKDSITLFKSVGASLEDLAAAIVLWERLQKA